MMKNQQAIDGLFLLDKPIGISSNRALQQVKRLFQAKKAGHTGSLDPLATGMLPILFGKGTKLAQTLLGADKCYHVTCQLGIQTSTGDAEGEIIKACAVPQYSLAQLAAVLQQFTGEIEQIPPMYSALKHQGKPLYTYARQGITIPRESRTLTIHSLKLLAHDSTTLQLSVECSSGTYIRTLAEDIGAALDCCAHVTALHRTTVNPFSATQMITLPQLTALAEGENAQEQCLNTLMSLAQVVSLLRESFEPRSGS